MVDQFEWPPLESNPEIFTKYMHDVGMSKDWAIGEVFGFDEELLAFLPQPIIGVIVNMERLKKEQDVAKGSEDHVDKVAYYQKQEGKLDNACGVIACLHAVYNNLDKVNLDQGSVLAKFFDQVKDKSPKDRATELEGYKDFQEAHKGFAAQG